jgi:hypothetical protein
LPTSRGSEPLLPPSSRERGGRALAAAVVGVIYLAALAMLPKHVFWSPDEGVKYLQMHAVQWSEGLAFSLPYPRERLERRLGSQLSRCEAGGFYPIPGPDGTVRFHWPMWFPSMSRPLFDALGISGIYVIPLLSGLFTALLAGRLCAQFDRTAGPAAVLLVGLGTPVFFYSVCFWEHTLATLLGMAAITLLVLAPPGRGATLLVIAPLLLLAVLVRMELLALAAACAVSWAGCRLAARSRPAPDVRAGAAMAGGRWAALVVCLTALTLLVAMLPGAVAPRHWQIVAELPEILLQTLHRLPALPESLVSFFIHASADGPAVRPTAAAGAFLAAGTCFIAPLYRPRRLESWLLFPAMLTVLAFSASILLSDRPYGALHGVVPLAPYMVVAGYTCQAAWRRYDYRLLTLATAALSYMIIAFLVVFARDHGGPQWGLEWGPRYVLTLYPMMAVLAVLALRVSSWEGRAPLARRAFRALLIAMMVVAVAFEARGVMMLYQRRTEIVAWNDVLRDAGPIVTDVWWLPAAVAPLFLSRQLYCVGGRQELSAWLAAAPLPEETTITVASFAPFDIEPPAPSAPSAGRPMRRSSLFLEGSKTAAGMHFARVRLSRGGFVPPATAAPELRVGERADRHSDP